MAAGALALFIATGGEAAAEPPAPEGAVRVAVFNTALSRRDPGRLVQDLRLGGSRQVEIAAETIQRVRPDVILLAELDHDRRAVAAKLFRDYLATGRGGAEGIDYPHLFSAPVNTGAPSGFDLDGDGRVGGPRDAFGFGWFEGQYGMAILSRLPIDEAALRSFRNLRWASMPGSLLPFGHYGEAAASLRLSSKSHWDAPVILPDGRRLHVLASHPTPPVFDGPEDANGRRNHDEIRFWVDYIEGADWMKDDAGAAGGLPEGADFVLLGDLNADPRDGDARRGALEALLALTSDPAPVSEGAARAPGDATDTADWPEEHGPGPLRVDYALPSKGLTVLGAGVFWPGPGAPLRRLVEPGDEDVSDHRLVWVDIR
ncbi:MAG: endonuclease/exonuclease/phosphatase family protein [Pikeienuella sp.]